MYLSDTETRTALLQIDLFDSTNATLNTLTLNVDKDSNWQTFATTDLDSLDGTTGAGLALYKDDGDGIFDAEDTLLGTQPSS